MLTTYADGVSQRRRFNVAQDILWFFQRRICSTYTHDIGSTRPQDVPCVLHDVFPRHALQDICTPGRYPGHPPPVLKRPWGMSWGQKVCPPSAKAEIYVVEHRVCWRTVLKIRRQYTSWGIFLQVDLQDVSRGYKPMSWRTCPFFECSPRQGGLFAHDIPPVVGIRRGQN